MEFTWVFPEWFHTRNLVVDYNLVLWWLKLGWYQSIALLLHWGIVMSYRYSDVIMSAMASQITSLMIVYSTVYSGTDQRKHRSSATLAFMRGIHRKRASNAENISIWWRHHDIVKYADALLANMVSVDDVFDIASLCDRYLAIVNGIVPTRIQCDNGIVFSVLIITWKSGVLVLCRNDSRRKLDHYTPLSGPLFTKR